mgnify:FL=1
MRRTKILVLCQENQSVVDCMKDWYHVLKDETNGIKMEEWGRISTPFVIMDFVTSKPIFFKEYAYILPKNISSEEVLSIAIGSKKV